jgi:ketosteroid isomerase-like protein
MHHRFCRIFSATIVLFAFGCAPAVATEAADRAAIEAAAQSWMTAYNAQDAERMVTMSTSDIVLLDPTMPAAKGAQAAREALQKSASRHQVTSTTQEIVIKGDVAWRIGALKQKTPGARTSTTQSLEIWERTDGQWKLRRQMSSGLLARAPLLRPPLSEPHLDRERSRAPQ